MRKYLKLIRVNHWLKNGLVFLPLFFSGNMFDLSMLLTCVLAFIIFCFTASIVYIINDISDIDDDKNHPIKKNRPLASGVISIKQAIFIIIILVILIATLISYLYTNVHNIFIILIPLTYILINILYSKGLKNIAIIDVLVLVSGFLFRVMYGGVSVDITVSKYLYLMVIFGSFYLGFGKRRGEVIKNGDKSRKVLSKYNKEFLDKNMYVAFGLAIVSYTLWCIEPSVVERVGHDYMFWTIPLLMSILQLYSLNIEKDSFGDPVDVILNDKILFCVGFIYIIVMIFLLYII